jgi:hypothetical protein
MKNERIADWVKIFESPEILEAELTEARLRDEGIECMVLNKTDIGYTVEIGTYWTYNSGKPVQIFVHPQQVVKAKDIINEDRSKLLDDPEIDYGKTEDDLEKDNQQDIH